MLGLKITRKHISTYFWGTSNNGQLFLQFCSQLNIFPLLFLVTKSLKDVWKKKNKSNSNNQTYIFKKDFLIIGEHFKFVDHFWLTKVYFCRRVSPCRYTKHDLWEKKCVRRNRTMLVIFTGENNHIVNLPSVQNNYKTTLTDRYYYN